MEETLGSARILCRLLKTRRKVHIVIFYKVPEYRYLVEDKLKDYYEIVASQHFKKVDLSFVNGFINANLMSFPSITDLLTSRYNSSRKHKYVSYQIRHLLNYVIHTSSS